VKKIMEQKFKVGDKVKGIRSDVEGLILEVTEVNDEGYVLKTLNNSYRKFSHINYETHKEYKIGGFFKRHNFWDGCLELVSSNDSWDNCKIRILNEEHFKAVIKEAERKGFKASVDSSYLIDDEVTKYIDFYNGRYWREVIKSDKKEIFFNPTNNNPTGMKEAKFFNLKKGDKVKIIEDSYNSDNNGKIVTISRVVNYHDGSLWHYETYCRTDIVNKDIIELVEEGDKDRIGIDFAKNESKTIINGKVIIMEAPKTQLEKTACKKAKEEAIKKEIEAKQRIYNKGMEDFILAETKAREWRTEADDLKKKLGITDNEMKELF
jgi:hypothetical protein